MKQNEDLEAAAEEARWLAELARAISRAQRLSRTLGASPPGRGPDVLELCDRLEAVQLEIEALRSGSRDRLRRPIDPSWTGLVPWDRRRET